MARQFAEEFYKKQKGWLYSHRPMVLTFNGSTRAELLESYCRIADHLGYQDDVLEVRRLPPEDKLSQGLQILAAKIKSELLQRSEWLMIIDNLTSSVKPIKEMTGHYYNQWRSIIPQPGDSSWGKGLVLVTTKEGELVEKTGDIYTDWYSVEKGFTDSEGIELLEAISGIKDEVDDAQNLVKTLEGIPLSVAAAGCYIKKEQEWYRRRYGFANYLKNLKKAGRDFGEKQTKPICSYPWTLTAAIAMSIQQHKHLYKVFCLLAYCAHVPLPMRLVGHVIEEPRDVVTKPVQDVRDCTLMLISYFRGINEMIEEVSVHEATWNVIKEMFLYSSAATEEEPAENLCPALVELIDLEVLDWFPLGLKLGIGEYHLRVIEKNHPKDCEECKMKMFSKWLRVSSKENCNYRKLVEALEEIGEVRIAQELRKKYGIPFRSTSSVYTQKQRYDLLQHFAVCLVEEHEDAMNLESESPLHEMEHHLLPHMETIISHQMPGYPFTPTLQFKLFYSLGVLYFNTYDRPKAKHALKKAKQAAEGDKCCKENNPYQYDKAVLYLGKAYSFLGKDEKADICFDAARESLRDRCGEESIEYAKALIKIAGSYIQREDFNEAKAMLQKSLKTLKEQCGPSHPDVAAVLTTLGDFLINIDSAESAVGYLEDAVEILKAAPGKITAESLSSQIFGESSIHTGIAISGASVASHLLGNLKQSKEHADKAVQLFEGTHASLDHQAVARRYHNLSAIYCIQGEFTKAEILCQSAAVIGKRTNSGQLLYFGRFLFGCTAAVRGQMKEAYDIFKQAILQPLDKNHSVLLCGLCMTCLELGKVSEAQKILTILQNRPAVHKLIEAPVALLQDLSNPDNLPISHMFFSLVNSYVSMENIQWQPFSLVLKGLLHLSKGGVSLAQQCLSQAISDYDSMLGSNHPMTIEALYFLGMSYFGHPSSADTHLNRVVKRAGSYAMSAKAVFGLARIFLKHRLQQEALQHFTRALDMYTTIPYFNDCHPRVASVHCHLALLYKEQDREAAVRHASEGAAIIRTFIQRETDESVQMEVCEDIKQILSKWNDKLHELSSMKDMLKMD